MVDDENKQYVPLTMHDQIIGRISFDLITGEISGYLEDPELQQLLTILFVEGLAEVSFLGKASMPIANAVQKIREFKESREDPMAGKHVANPDTDLSTPEPPKETNLGKDSTSANEVAQKLQDGLVEEEERDA